MKPSFDLETRHHGLVAGVDEAGCGPWAGPVVAGACLFLNREKPVLLLKQINDSKKLSAKKREAIFQELMQLPQDQFCYGVGIADVDEIDKFNIGQATRLAMQRAMAELIPSPMVVLVDGIRKPDLAQQTINIVKGDEKSYSIAAASIIAKVTRDRIMRQLDQKFPEYGWSQNAGYGTAKHRAALDQFGVTSHHRRSFAPIAALLKNSLM